ncbi:MAG: multicopper oxidase domain-containing protein [Dehalococcoidia bacterium]
MRGRRGLAIAILVLMVMVATGALGPHGPVLSGGATTTQTPVREFFLTAEPVRWQIEPGTVVDGWGYNGQTPGPMIRVTEGDLVRVHLTNRLPAPTTIHWHGIDVPAAMDGVPGLSQDPVEPGESFLYEFIATNPGTRWYHSHVDSNAQIALGLYGAFIIDPRRPEPTHYDREFTYILTEKALDFTPRVALGEADVRNREAGNGRGGLFQSDLFLMNGKAGSAIEPLTIAAGERIRIRLINAGNLVHSMHLHGHTFTIIATDGNPVPPAARLQKDVVLVGSAERYDLEVVGSNPGVWMFHCHINNHSANGMVTVLSYDGATPLAGGDHGASTRARPRRRPGPQRRPRRWPRPGAGRQWLPHVRRLPAQRPRRRPQSRCRGPSIRRPAAGRGRDGGGARRPASCRPA